MFSGEASEVSHIKSHFYNAEMNHISIYGELQHQKIFRTAGAFAGSQFAQANLNSTGYAD